MRILLADDHPEVCSALRLLLEQGLELQVTAEVGDTASLLACAERDCPDLLVLDWELPGSPLDTVLRRLRSRVPGMRVLALSGRPEAKLAALAAGASGFVDKGGFPEQFINAIRDFEQTQAGQASGNPD